MYVTNLSVVKKALNAMLRVYVNAYQPHFVQMAVEPVNIVVTKVIAVRLGPLLAKTWLQSSIVLRDLSPE